MEFKEITNQETWDQKISLHDKAQFLQSWEWGEFQKNLGRKVFRLEIDGEYFQVVKMNLPLDQSYLYIPRTGYNLSQETVNKLAALAKEEKCMFVRVEPVSQYLKFLNFKKTRAIQPEKSLLLDLSLSEADLLAQMHQKTRYNFRLAEKKGVKIIKSSDIEAEHFLVFYDLMLDTYRRKKRSLHPREYYQKLLQSPLAKLYFAQYNGKILCANMIISYGDIVTYLHGGSSQEDKNIMAPHFLQWETIKQAKSAGYKYYDFWGIDENKWPGVTRFKQGFGGFEVDYAGTWDLPVKKIPYWLYNKIKMFK